MQPLLREPFPAEVESYIRWAFEVMGQAAISVYARDQA